MVFFIGQGATVTLRSLTVRHGRVTTQGHGGGITLYGQYCGSAGGLATQRFGKLTVTNSTFFGNSTNKTFSGTGIVTGNQASLNLDSSVATNGASSGTHTLDAEGNLRLSDSRTVRVQIENLIPDTQLEAWIFSTPTQLGAYTTPADGSFAADVRIGSEIPDGTHRFVIKQVTPGGNETVMSVGIAIGETVSGGYSIRWIIIATIGLAALAALALPARRRRRRATTS